MTAIATTRVPIATLTYLSTFRLNRLKTILLYYAIMLSASKNIIYNVKPVKYTVLVDGSH